MRCKSYERTDYFQKKPFITTGKKAPVLSKGKGADRSVCCRWNEASAGSKNPKHKNGNADKCNSKTPKQLLVKVFGMFCKHAHNSKRKSKNAYNTGNHSKNNAQNY